MEVDGASSSHRCGVARRFGVLVADDVWRLVVSRGDEAPVDVFGVPACGLRHGPGLGVGMEVLVVGAISGVAPDGAVGESGGGKASEEGEPGSEMHSRSGRTGYERIVV